jgi:hypothetical protein
MNHVQIPVEFVASGPAVTGGARILLVDRSYLELMNATVVAGRSLGDPDFTPESRSVVVNQAFVDRVLGDETRSGASSTSPSEGG